MGMDSRIAKETVIADGLENKHGYRTEIIRKEILWEADENWLVHFAIDAVCDERRAISKYDFKNLAKVCKVAIPFLKKYMKEHPKAYELDLAAVKQLRAECTDCYISEDVEDFATDIRPDCWEELEELARICAIEEEEGWKGYYHYESWA